MTISECRTKREIRMASALVISAHPPCLLPTSGATAAALAAEVDT